MSTVRKAVFPAAGLGTRFLPATKAQPKEMLVLVDKPIIQYGVEEAVASGVDNIILVTGPRQERDRGPLRRLGRAGDVPRGARQDGAAGRDPQGVQPDQLRLRAAGRAARPRSRRAGDARPGRPGAVRRHPGRRRDRRRSAGAAADGRRLRARCRARSSRSSGCPRRTSRPTASCRSPRRSRAGVYRVKDLVEKPKREDAPSNLAIIGRYILTPDIFPALEATQVDRTGEIQLTNGLRRLLKDRPIYACEIKGVRHDTGNKLGFLKAVVYFALRRPDLADGVQGVPARDGCASASLGDSRGRYALSPPDVLGGARRARRRRSCADVGVAGRLRSCDSDEAGAAVESELPVDVGGLSASAPAAALPRVVGDVPAGSLELDGRRRQQPLHLPAALLARVHRTRPRTSGSPRT